MNEILEEVYGKREKEQAFQKFEKAYINKRNDCMFTFKFVSPYVTHFYNIKANHGIALFMMSKRAYMDIKQLKKDMEARKNIFKLQKYFEEFAVSQTYRNMLEQVTTDMDMVQAQSICYSSDIEMCSKEISA